jgi:CheY-like chemotaxis protein
MQVSSTAKNIIKKGLFVETVFLHRSFSEKHLCLSIYKNTTKGSKGKPMESRSPKVILVVEDDFMIRFMCVRTLSKENYRVLESENPEEAIAMCNKEEHIDLMILDKNLPSMHGKRLYDTLKLLQKNTDVLFISGFGESEANENFLPKPFFPEDLKKKVADILQGESL